MSKHRKILLSFEQHQQLNNLIRSGNAKARSITRARILLLSDGGEHGSGQRRTGEEIAAALLCSRGTVQNIQHRFLDEGLEGALQEKPRPGASLRPKITGEVEAKLIALACSPPPQGRKCWTLQMLADQLVELNLVESISDVAVMKRLKKRSKTLAG
jgi:transposase